MAALQNELPGLIAVYGCWVVALIIALESIGIPLPGETILVAASVYAGMTDQLSILDIIVAASLGAIVGDAIGYWLGREFGYQFILRYGRRVGMTERRIKLARYLFLLHGGKVVFWGRFVAVLRMAAAFLAGANHMDRRRFFLFNISGGITWAAIFGGAGFYLGESVHLFMGPAGISAASAAALALAATAVIVRRHQARLYAEAERAFPGPLLVTSVRRR